MSARAAVIVTGTEVLTGIISDANGPWLSQRLREVGVDCAQITVVGDRPEDLLAALRHAADLGVDLVVTSGGLGPTADDLTADVVADFCARPLALDEALQARVRAVVERLSARWPNRDPEAMAAGWRKQAHVPDGATVLEPIGTAPGFVVPPPPGSAGGPYVLVLPGPPGELQPMWEDALGGGALEPALGGAVELRTSMLRLWGIPEADIAQTLRVLADDGLDLSALEITTCLRRGEIEIATTFRPAAQGAYDRLAAGVRARHGAELFSADEGTVDEVVARGLLAAGLTVATAESCTGGLLAARLTERPGSSAYVQGGLVVYANAAKTALAGVPESVIEAHGAVSPEVAALLADGARAALGASVGIGITGVAGPDGGTPEKPVGMVCVSVSLADGRRTDRTLSLGGDRAGIRDRTTTHCMHLLRALLD